MLAWNFRFRTWRVTRAPGVLFLRPAEYSAVMCGAKNLSDVTVASSQYDLLLCSETLVSDRRHMSELLVPGFGCPVLLCRDGVPRARGPVGWLHMCEMVMGHFANLNFSVAVVRCWYSRCVVLDRTSMYSVCIATLT